MQATAAWSCKHRCVLANHAARCKLGVVLLPMNVCTLRCTNDARNQCQGDVYKDMYKKEY